MAINRLAAVAGLLGLGALLSLGSVARTQQPAQPDASAQPAQANPEGMEVLARGPIHEAYAEPVAYQPKATKVVPKQTPDPIDEVPPDQKPAGDNVQWIPGYWAWDDDRTDFVWVSGIWRIPPPDRQWVPGHWDHAEGGWQWTPGFWQAAQEDQIEYLPPPPAPPEGAAAASTPAPSEDSVYIPGSYVYRDTRYFWRPGYWVDYRPGWVWIPAHYVWTPCGYVFVEGYWDFELDRRGLMFAPIYFTEQLWLRPRWYFRPAYAVFPDFLFTALFLRPGYYSYYFGDYFDPAYRRGGFVSWLDYRFGRFGYDPLFTYYRWSYRDNPTYFRNLQGLYAARYSGQAPRPPRTLVQQSTVINNTNINTTNIKNVTVLAPLAQMDRKVVRLQPVSQQQLSAITKSAQEFRQASSQRAQGERKLLASGAPTKQAAAPRTLQLALPKTAAPARVESRNQPPAPPVPPRSSRTPQTRPETGRQPVTPRPEGRQPTIERPKTEPRPRTEPQPKPGAEPRPQPKPQPKAEPKAEPRPQPRPAEPRPQPKAEPRPAEPRPQPKAEPRPPEPRPQPKAEPRPQPKPEPKPGTEAPKAPESKK